jgi:hypothetical protein
MRATGIFGKDRYMIVCLFPFGVEDTGDKGKQYSGEQQYC